MKLSEVYFYSILAHGKLQYVDEFLWFKHFAEKTLQSSFQYSIKINEQKKISQNDKFANESELSERVQYLHYNINCRYWVEKQKALHFDLR